MQLLNATHHQTHFKVTHYAKVYPDSIDHFVYRESFDKKIDGWELRNPPSPSLKPVENSKEDNEIRSIRRTKTVISDYIRCNEFDLFGTFTFAKKRQDETACRRKMKRWLANQQIIHGTFKYLIIPEYHKDGKSIHFHALLKNYKGTLVPAKTKTKHKRKIYNIKSYRSGFSTAVKIDDHQKVASYVKKYITKDMIGEKNQRRYWSSKNLVKPEIIYNPEGLEGIGVKIYETQIFEKYRIDKTKNKPHNDEAN